MNAPPTPTPINDCVDCGMTILGETPRCPRCHERHVDKLWSAKPNENVDGGEVTAPRPRQRSWTVILLEWFVGAQFVVAIVLGAIIVVTRGCPR